MQSAAIFILPSPSWSLEVREWCYHWRRRACNAGKGGDGGLGNLGRGEYTEVIHVVLKTSKVGLKGAPRGIHQGARKEQEPAHSDDQTPTYIARTPSLRTRYQRAQCRQHPLACPYSRLLTTAFSRRPPLPPLRRSHLRSDPDSAEFLLSLIQATLAFNSGD